MLIQAVRRDDYHSVMFLLDQPEINTKITDIYGLSAMDYAKKAPDSKIACYFELLGLNQDPQETQENSLSSKLMHSDPRFFKTSGAVPVSLDAENSPRLR